MGSPAGCLGNIFCHPRLPRPLEIWRGRLWGQSVTSLSLPIWSLEASWLVSGHPDPGPGPPPSGAAFPGSKRSLGLGAAAGTEGSLGDCEWEGRKLPVHSGEDVPVASLAEDRGEGGWLVGVGPGEGHALPPPSCARDRDKVQDAGRGVGSRSTRCPVPWCRAAPSLSASSTVPWLGCHAWLGVSCHRALPVTFSHGGGCCPTSCHPPLPETVQRFLFGQGGLREGRAASPSL